MLNGKDACSISDVLKEIIPLNIAFPTLIKVLQIALTIVVTTAECERSFSCLKRTKNYLRSSMSEQRLIDLAVCPLNRNCQKSFHWMTLFRSLLVKTKTEEYGYRNLIVKSSPYTPCMTTLD